VCSRVSVAQEYDTQVCKGSRRAVRFLAINQQPTLECHIRTVVVESVDGLQDRIRLPSRGGVRSCDVRRFNVE
jgi:hypothetical protein